jgi:hypothetical protein
MTRNDLRLTLARLAAVSAAIAIGALGVSAGSGLAANTRIVIVGSPGATDGTLIVRPSPVSSGRDAAFDVTVTNVGNQTLTHVAVMGGAAAEATSNPLFPPPTFASLPTGASYVAAYPANPAAPCTISSTGDSSISCPVGNLPPGASASFRLVLKVPTLPATDPATYPFWIEVDLNEGTSSTGSNQDTFYATGALDVAAPSCEGVADFFLAGAAVLLTNAQPATCAQTTQISSASASTGTFASIALNTNPPACPSGFTCFGYLSGANVNDGVGSVEWTISWQASLYGTGKPKGVLHFLDGGGYVVISFGSKNACTTSNFTNCWVSTTATKTSFTAVIRTPSNGSIRGW